MTKTTFARTIFAAAVMVMGVLPVSHATVPDDATSFLQELKDGYDALKQPRQLAYENGQKEGLKADLTIFENMKRGAAERNLKNAYFFLHVQPYDEYQILFWHSFADTISKRLGVHTELRCYLGYTCLLYFSWDD